MGLTKNTAQSAHGALALPGNDRGIDSFAGTPDELYVTAF